MHCLTKFTVISAVKKTPTLAIKMQANSELSSPGWPFPSSFPNGVMCSLRDVQSPFENRDGMVSSKRAVSPSSTAKVLHLALIVGVPPLVLTSLWQQQNTTETQDKNVLVLFITIKCQEEGMQITVTDKNKILFGNVHFQKNPLHQKERKYKQMGSCAFAWIKPVRSEVLRLQMQKLQYSHLNDL